MPKFSSVADGLNVPQDGDNVSQTKVCLFGMADSMEKIRAFEQVSTFINETRNTGARNACFKL